MGRFVFEDIAFTLETLPDDPSPAQFRCLMRESLDRIEFTRKRWQCQGKGCTNGSHVRDYGIGPWYFMDTNSKGSHSHPLKYWRQIPPWFLLCGKHNKIWNRLKKAGYDEEHIARRICDFDKPRLVDCIK